VNSTVIMHFHNEEYLLPWWLEHHTRLFSAGVLLDRGSTDRSREICERMAPHWRLMTLDRELEVEANDIDLMHVELKTEGWKIILTTTEFFCCRDMGAYLEALDADGASMYRVPGFAILDDPTLDAVPVSASRPLVDQRHHGYYDPINHSRLIHRVSHGRYHPGRHHSAMSYAGAPPGAVVKWFAFSPWNEQMMQRKLQIQHTLSPRDKARGFGAQHFVDREELEVRYRLELTRASDLRSDVRYREVFPQDDAAPPCGVRAAEATYDHHR
jgi:hypothetical protein